jgi:hypothetical protein
MFVQYAQLLWLCWTGMLGLCCMLRWSVRCAVCGLLLVTCAV